MISAEYCSRSLQIEVEQFLDAGRHRRSHDLFDDGRGRSIEREVLFAADDLSDGSANEGIHLVIDQLHILLFDRFGEVIIHSRIQAPFAVPLSIALAVSAMIIAPLLLDRPDRG
jgi:hypothetical protein